MVTVTRSMDSKGALEHIISVLLVYDLRVKDCLTSLGAYDSHDFMELTILDFQQDFQFSDTEDPTIVSRASNYCAKTDFTPTMVCIAGKQ